MNTQKEETITGKEEKELYNEAGERITTFRFYADGYKPIVVEILLSEFPKIGQIVSEFLNSKGLNTVVRYED